MPRVTPSTPSKQGAMTAAAFTGLIRFRCPAMTCMLKADPSSPGMPVQFSMIRALKMPVGLAIRKMIRTRNETKSLDWEDM